MKYGIRKERESQLRQKTIQCAIQDMEETEYRRDVHLVPMASHFRLLDEINPIQLGNVESVTSQDIEINVLQLLLELEVDNASEQPEESITIRRRRAGKLRVNVNARTNNGRGFTALRLVEENHGGDNECAELLRQVGGVSMGFGDGEDDGEDDGEE